MITDSLGIVIISQKGLRVGNIRGKGFVYLWCVTFLHCHSVNQWQRLLLSASLSETEHDREGGGFYKWYIAGMHSKVHEIVTNITAKVYTLHIQFYLSAQVRYISIHFLGESPPLRSLRPAPQPRRRNRTPVGRTLKPGPMGVRWRGVLLYLYLLSTAKRGR